MGEKKEYIERGALIAEYDRVHVGAPGGARKLMVDAPAADVVEVRHGEWVHKDGEMYCSACGNDASMYKLYYESPYCPCCGACMDGERKEQT